MDSETPLEVRRFILLLHQLHEDVVAERGREHGAVQAIVDRLGVSQGTVSRILNGDRISVGLESVDKARRVGRIHWRFFSDPTLRNPHYRDFLRGEARRRREEPGFIFEFVQKREVPPRLHNWLQSLWESRAAFGGLSWRDLDMWLIGALGPDAPLPDRRPSDSPPSTPPRSDSTSTMRAVNPPNEANRSG